MTRGRRPAGADYVDRVPGSPQAKERVRVILQTMQGKLRVQQACKKLRVSPQRFHQLREEIMRAAVASIEPGAPGRPPRTVTPAEQQIEVLQQQLAAQEFELRFAKARAEIAATLPAVVQPTDAQQPKRKKKKRQRRSPSQCGGRVPDFRCHRDFGSLRHSQCSASRLGRRGLREPPV